MSSNQYLSSKNRLFEHLQQLDNILYFPKTFIDMVKFFKNEFKFLDIFFRLQSFTHEPNLLDVTQKIQSLFRDAAVEFSELHLDNYCDFNNSVQNEIWSIKMEIKAKYSFPKISLPLSANKDGIAIPKFVTEFIHSVVENLPNLVKIDDSCSLLYVPETMEHVDVILKEVNLLHNFFCFVSERFVEPQSQHLADFFTHVLAVAGYASTFFWLYLPDLAPEEINVLLSDFLRMRIKPIQPCIREIYVNVLQSLKATIQSGWYPNIQREPAADTEASFVKIILHNLAELPANSNSSQRVALNDHLANLQEMLNLLRANIIHAPIQDLELLSVLRYIDTVIIDVGLLVYSLYKGEDEEKEDIALAEVNPAQVLDQLPGNIQHIISAVIYPTIRKAFQSKLPGINGLGYVDFLLNNLKEFQSRHSDSLASVTKQLQIIQKDFESSQPFLKAVSQAQHNDLDKIQSCATQLINKAYEVEYIVDACICKVHVWCLEHWLLDIMEEITLITTDVADIQGKNIVEDAMDTGTIHTSLNWARSPMMNDELVGFKDVIEDLRYLLIRGTRGRDVISIVGMPGLGKTTLAYRLYSDRSIVSYFDIRAMCCVSQIYSRKHLLLAILRDVIGEDSKRRENHADELANELRKALFSKRYLILVDDVWEASAWDDLIGCFHDGNNGSRIILTTRNHEVANYARSESDPLQLRMFNDDESWELLRKKVFGDESFSPLLTKVGQKIAKKCGRLPLSIALVAGILAETEKKEECWEQVANNLGPRIHKDSRAIIEQSYQMLPYHLRSCFLYFGAFLEDSVINVSKLTRLWISEGFVKSCEGKSLEDIAKGYLENLFGRNLVMGTKRSSGGEIKACLIHDLLHDFCKERAAEENLLVSIKRRDQNTNPSSCVYCHKQLAHRMSIYGEDYHIGESSSYLSHVGSFIMHNRVHLTCRELSHIFYTYKFLKVLDLEFTCIDSFPTDLVYLRYLAAKTSKPSISSFIANCWNLETLIIHNDEGKMSVPITLWEMIKLRHLHISKCSFIIENAEELHENSKTLYDLKTLSTPCFSCVEDAELMLGKTPNLRELKCRVKGIDNFQYYVLNFPTGIETLKIQNANPKKKIPFCISAPNLKNLKLKYFHLHPQHLLGIASLQNLQVLKLECVYFKDREWKVSNGEFPQLKVLKLHNIISLREWTVHDDAFPNLEHLVLRHCYSLEEIPSCFRDISSLKSIVVRICNDSVDKSARDIWETQVEDYQNSEFRISITSKA
uniref:Late blight resistance protein R1-A-like n=3 Tax=Nicotiana TaxID=4085 RepID=A0A1S3Z2J6_TOBAC|nr:PREDICTED: late blight resistance protein R1-A-like [Nicotiana sylvestris]XP_016458650.1 PREDICTED: late blight resistance protein R1-A-like [Nicotiana tabacum]